MKSLPRALLALGLAASLPNAQAQEMKTPTDVEFTGHVVKPAKAELSEDALDALTLPDGFKINVFAKDLINPRMMAVAQDGTVYVTRRSVGDVVMLRDTDGDGKADEQSVVANRPQMHGIAIEDDEIYLATVTDVYRANIKKDGTLSDLQRIIDDLPDGGQHPNRTLGIGPDGMLYISVGSTCNACAETNPEAATLLRAAKDGTKRRIFASGLRNTIGFGWHPATKLLYGMDHNVDWHGDDQPGEELNLLEEGKKYGWPYVFANGMINPQAEPAGVSSEDWKAASKEPLLLYTAHAAPMQMSFYDGTAFPAEYAGNAFVAMRGSWNRKPPSGYEIARIVFENDKPVRIEPFLTGFLTERDGTFQQTARPAGIAIAKDGAILLSDDANGVIYRIAYEGGEAPAANDPRVAEAPATDPKQDAVAEKPQLAAAALDIEGKPTLSVTSPAFSNRERIPLRYTDYGHKVSPALSWSKGPESTKSYAIVMDDPDAKPKLFHHWSLFNIPAEVTELPEGIPNAPGLELPKGAEQTSNSLGSVGYFGPRTPAGDPPHRYHFQVFALDTVLDLPAGSDRDALLDAMRGHVVASGTLIGTFERRARTERLVNNAKDVAR